MLLQNINQDETVACSEASCLKKYIIGSPKNKTPITLKILNKKLHYKLLFRPDLYFGEAYSDGDIVIENGTLTDFLDLAISIAKDPHPHPISRIF